MRKSHLRVFLLPTPACVGKLLDDDGPRDEQDSGRLSYPVLHYHSLHYRWRSVFGERVDFQLNNLFGCVINLRYSPKYYPPISDVSVFNFVLYGNDW